MASAANNHDARMKQRSRPQVQERIALGHRHDCEIDDPLAHVGDHLGLNAFENLDTQAGILLMERGNCARNEVQRRGHGHPHRHRSDGTSTQQLQIFGGASQLGLDQAGPFDQVLARAGQRHPVLATHEQRQRRLLCELAQALRQRRLRQPKLAGGRPQASGFHDREQIAQVMQPDGGPGIDCAH